MPQRLLQPGSWRREFFRHVLEHAFQGKQTMNIIYYIIESYFCPRNSAVELIWVNSCFVELFLSRHLSIFLCTTLLAGARHRRRLI